MLAQDLPRPENDGRDDVDMVDGYLHVDLPICMHCFWALRDTYKPEALTNPRFLDAHLGQGEKLLAYTLFHVDGLLRIANDAVEVSM